MSDPHEQGRISRDHYFRKTEVTGRIVVVLDWATDDRDIRMMPHLSRAVRQGEILELVATDEEDSGAGATVDHVAYLGFMEVTEGGLLIRGDRVSIGKEQGGEIAGFDETHMPNHLNVVIRVKTRQTGRAAGLELNALVKVAEINEKTEKQIGF